MKQRWFQVFLRCLEGWDTRPGRLRVLAYHRVDIPMARPDLSPQMVSATPDAFERQLAYLVDRYRVVSLHDVVAFLESRRPLPRRAVLITFDDAYQDFARHAWPLLKAYGVPVTLFVPTGYPDRPGVGFWWDRLYQAHRHLCRCSNGGLRLGGRRHGDRSYRHLKDQVKRLPASRAEALVERLCRRAGIGPVANPVLGWDALRSLAQEGVTLCPHTRTHPLLHRVSLARARDELLGSYQDLERQVGSIPRVFAYPNGFYTAGVLRVLREAGFVAAFTTLGGTNDLGTSDPLRLRRILIGRKTIHPWFQAQLVPWISALRTAIRPRRLVPA